MYARAYMLLRACVLGCDMHSLRRVAVKKKCEGHDLVTPKDFPKAPEPSGEGLPAACPGTADLIWWAGLNGLRHLPIPQQSCNKDLHGDWSQESQEML